MQIPVLPSCVELLATRNSSVALRKVAAFVSTTARILSSSSAQWSLPAQLRVENFHLIQDVFEMAG